MHCAYTVTLIAGDFHADYTGYAWADGPGKGLDRTTHRGGSGGGHGGRGGNSNGGYYSGYSYDSLYTPKQMGSGGGMGNEERGGRGGGKLLGHRYEAAGLTDAFSLNQLSRVVNVGECRITYWLPISTSQYTI